MKRKPLIAAALAIALVVGAGIAPAAAYFTDTTQATGTVEIKFPGADTEIHEWFADRVKHVVISNKEDSVSDVWVRAKVFAPANVPCAIAGSGWTNAPDSEGWYYYTSKLAPGAEAEELTVELTFPVVQSDVQPDGSVYGDNFNVVVVYESVLAEFENDVASFDNVNWTVSQSAEGGN